MKKITENMLIEEIIERDIHTVEILTKHGLNCLGCPAATTESLEEAAKGHGISVEKLVDELNQYFSSK